MNEQRFVLEYEQVATLEEFFDYLLTFTASFWLVAEFKYYHKIARRIWIEVSSDKPIFVNASQIERTIID